MFIPSKEIIIILCSFVCHVHILFINKMISKKEMIKILNKIIAGTCNGHCQNKQNKDKTKQKTWHQVYWIMFEQNP